MLVGCKVDKDHVREVPLIEVQQFAEYHNLLSIETSSKTGFNVEKAFHLISFEIHKMLEEGKFQVQEGWDGIKSGYMRPQIAPKIDLVQQNREDDKNKKKGCCS